MKLYAMGSGRWRSSNLSNRVLRFGLSLKLIPWLRAHATNYDCIIVHGFWNFGSAGCSLILPKLGVPYFVFAHGMLDPWFRKRYPVKNALKQVFWILFDGRLARYSRALLFTTEEEERLAYRGFWVHSYNSAVISHGVTRFGADADESSEFRSSIPGLSNRPYLLFMGRLDEKKGCDMLLKSFAKLRALNEKIDLVMAGPDQSGWAKTLRKMSSALGIEDAVHWTGMITGGRKVGAYQAAAALVLPSHQENFGLVVAEALSCGTPVLISDKVNIWPYVTKYEAGFVEANTQRGTDRLLMQFCNLSPRQYSEMRLAAARCFEDNFDISKNADQFYEKLRNILGRS